MQDPSPLPRPAHPRGEPAWRRYLHLIRPDHRADVDDELRFHLEMREREYLASGMEPDEARATALRRFGDVGRFRDACYEIGQLQERDMRISDFLDGVRQDVAFALRQLGRSKVFTAAAVLTLALGIGANGLVFSMVDALLLRPLPGVTAPDRLIELTAPSVSYPSYRDFRDSGNPALAGLAGFSNRRLSVGDASRTELVTGSAVTGNYFSVLGVRAARGRLLADADDAPGAEPVAVISHGFWERTFDADPAIVGRATTINGVSVTIVGVAERGFTGTRLGLGPAVWLPIHRWPDVAPTSLRGLSLEQRGWSWITMIGRLRAGATEEAAVAALNASARRQELAYPRETRTDYRIVRWSPASAAAIPGGSRETVVTFMAVLTGVVAIVLLIACANIANLLLSRAASRRRELGVRLALGAGRARLVRQLLTETTVLALLAAVVGVALVGLATRALRAVSTPAELSVASLGIDVDGRVLAFTAAVALLASLVFGAAPALHGTRSGVTVALKDGAPGSGHTRSRLRGVLLVAQVALSLVLLIGAGLFTRSLQRALATDVGVDGNGLAVATVNVGLARYDTARAAGFYGTAAERLTSTPGVERVAWATLLPLGSDVNSESFRIEGYVPAEDERLEAEVSGVSPGFLEAFRIPLARGRTFDASDVRGAQRVVIVNETMARRYWRDGDPVGRRIILVADTVTIVGVARDVIYHELREEPRPYLYYPIAQAPRSLSLEPMHLVVRTTGDPEQVLPAAVRAIRDAGPDVPVFDVGTFAGRAGRAVQPQRLGASVLGAFSLLALLIASVGVYGVVAYAVASRTREIGIRMALGARGGSVVRMLLAENLGWVVAGTAIGVALAVVAAPALGGLLYGVSATDVATFVGTSALLLAVGAVAAIIPARRATRVDPVSALRAD